MPAQKNISVTQGEHFEKFLVHHVETGSYGSISEAERAGLRLFEERETRLGTLRHSLIEGEAARLIIHCKAFWMSWKVKIRWGHSHLSNRSRVICSHWLFILIAESIDHKL